MKLPGRISAAIEVLGEIARRVPAADALRDWGKAHRFAGSADRHAIGTLVYDCLRRRNSLAHRMGSDAPRALAIAALHEVWQLAVTEIGSALTGEHGPGALAEGERESLLRPRTDSRPVHVAGDLPEWLAPDFVEAFGDGAAAEGAALASRAPIDLRANTLKADRDQVVAALARFGAAAGPWSPHAVRIAAPGPDARHINVEAEPAHGLGWFEVQDAASSISPVRSCPARTADRWSPSSHAIHPSQSGAMRKHGGGERRLSLLAVLPGLS
jgi:16S rRNA (cytosine967-C5)-methyltransferase